MINHTNKLLLVISLVTIPLIAKDFVDDFFDAEQKVMSSARTKAKTLVKDVKEGVKKTEEQLHKAGEEIKKVGKGMQNAIVSAFEAKVATAIQENENEIIITVDGIKAGKVDADISTDFETLTINADSTEVIITAKDKIVTVTVRHEVSIKEVNDKATTRGHSYAAVQESKMLKSPVLLGKQTINYDNAKQELVITAPKVVIKKTTRPVTVNMINSKQDVPVKTEEPVLVAPAVTGELHKNEAVITLEPVTVEEVKEVQ